MSLRPPALALALATILGACVAPVQPAAPPAGPPPPPELGIQPPTWATLDEVEHWLAGAGPRAHPDERVEAELYLAHGRLALAEEESARLPADTLDQRLTAAREGFQRVLADDAATGLERHHARVGLDRIRAFSAGSRVEPSTTLALHRRSTWGARAPVPARLTRHSGTWKRITVHHSAPPADRARIGSSAQAEEELRRIQRDHMDARRPRFGDIGYHFLIGPGGEIFEGRSLEWQGAHASGDNNVDNIGICVLGDFERTVPTPAALASLERLLDDLTARFHIPADGRGVVGHDELRPTECPGRNLRAWLDAYCARNGRMASR